MKIGVITNDETSVFQREVITGIRQAADACGYDVVVDSIAPDEAANPRPVALDMAALDGVLVIANILDDDVLREMHSSGKPLSLVSHRVSGTAIPAVMPDNAGGIEMLVNYLVGRGKRRIVFIQGDMNQNDGRERTIAFQRHLMRHDIDINNELFLRGDFTPRIAEQSLREFLAQGIEFDAVTGADYLMAITAMSVLREQGIQPMCVVGFGDGPEASQAGLTTIGVDVEKIGMRAARQLIGQIEGLHISGVTLLSTNIVERESC